MSAGWNATEERQDTYYVLYRTSSGYIAIPFMSHLLLRISETIIALLQADFGSPLTGSRERFGPLGLLLAPKPGSA